MAFIRSYSAQGDPRSHRTTMRAGRLIHSKILSAVRGRRPSRSRRRAQLAAGGDPFRLRLPKFVRKLTLKKVAGAVGKVAGFAAPFLTGGLSTVASLASNLAPHSQELVTQPEPTGPPSQVSRGYTVSGTEVTPDTSGQVYNVFDRRRRVQESEVDDDDSYDGGGGDENDDEADDETED